MRLELTGKVHGVSREKLIRAGMKGNIQGISATAKICITKGLKLTTIQPIYSIINVCCV